jgi:hypothetical protein
MELFLKFSGINNAEIIFPQFLDIGIEHFRNIGPSEVAVVSFFVDVVVHALIYFILLIKDWKIGRLQDWRIRVVANISIFQSSNFSILQSHNFTIIQLLNLKFSLATS